MMKYHVFNSSNLRVYDAIKDFYNDLPEHMQLNRKLALDIESLGNLQYLPSDMVNLDIDLF